MNRLRELRPEQRLETGSQPGGFVLEAEGLGEVVNFDGGHGLFYIGFSKDGYELGVFHLS